MQNRGEKITVLFGRKQYKVPIYQRRYAWDIENWNALWQDIKEKFDLRVNGNPLSHFTGIIITRKNENGGGIPKYDLIDGQQRLTTFQIILCVIRDICNEKNYKGIAKGADLLVKNENDEEKYKLCPKEGSDTMAFHLLVDNPEERGSSHIIYRAYENFMDKIKTLLGEESEKIGTLYDVITKDFYMIPIDLKNENNPEKLFASLNATGRMLDEFDYLRIDLFLNAGKDGAGLYKDYWHHFDTDESWEKQEKRDLFLRHFLEAKLGPTCFTKQYGREPKAFDVYQNQYRTKLKQNHQGIKHEFSELRKYSEFYQEMDCSPSKEFYDLFGITCWNSFLLFLVNERNITLEQLDWLFHILQSYTVRRMLCYGTSYKTFKGNNPHFIREIRKENRFDVAEFVKKLNGRGKPNGWPTDTEVANALRRLRMDVMEHFELLTYILYQIELESSKNSKLSFKDLYLKPIMPQSWEGTWRLPLGDKLVHYAQLFRDKDKGNPKWRGQLEDRLLNQSEPYRAALKLAEKRWEASQSIGNLAVVEKYHLRHFQSGQQYSFNKIKEVLERSELSLNKEIIKLGKRSWDVEQIYERTDNMIEFFSRVWPPAEHFTQNIVGGSGKSKTDSLLESQMHLFVTYDFDEPIELQQNTRKTYRVVGHNGINLLKRNILFAFPKSASSKLKSLLTDIDESIKKQEIKQGETYNIPDDSLSSTKEHQRSMKVVTHCGHILGGTINHFDKFHIHMEINGETVIVYRHGLHSRINEKEEQRIYVGNLPYRAKESDLEDLFKKYGSITSVKIIRDKLTERSKGFGFVEMNNQEDSERVIDHLNQKTFMGRPLKVQKARPRQHS